ncbi:peptidase, M50 family [Leptospira fainei serovar Hurstbridge str. BUT 6]|uniref:Peptidase, M50 family n=1 Tax=Leptospira fainei serovar Hurstbridge str. BUT 6 TaxID=1193011 RepID=S3V8R6_9LEPT|nr:site-2 protease family protein [Leptospira fainei]EPG72825.1 peptidase, M50 family [Leptospira fainei serovar Hurstbridge str. BUT 6]
MDRPKYGLHIVLFLLTFLTLTFQEETLNLPFLGWDWIRATLQDRYLYSLPVLGILLCHEMGHYLAARYYGIRATLPFFIPMPISPVGTMGAVIRIKEPIRDKKQLFDIGIWGPAMSLILSVPCYFIGLKYSHLVPISDLTNALGSNPAAFQVRFGESFFVSWANQFVLGPFDSNLYEVEIHPLAFAGWVGLLVTAINLLPFGQLDGGHVIYAIFGEGYRKWIYHLFSAFLVLAFWNYAWILWGLLIYYFIRVEHPYVPDPVFPLDWIRKVCGAAILLSLILIFTPSPMEIVTAAGPQSSLGEDIWNGIRNLFGK